MKIDYEKLFEGLEQVPGFDKTRASTLIEAAITTAVEEKAAELTEAHNAEITSLTEAHAAEVIDLKENAELYADVQSDKVLTETTANLDKYMGSILHEWAEDNAVAIDSNIKVELAESMFSGLVGVFNAYNVAVPDAASLNESTQLQEQSDLLRESLDSEIESRIELEASLVESQREAAILRQCVGLTRVEVDRITQLSESFDFDIKFEDRVKILRESLGEPDPLNTDGGGVDTSALNEGAELDDEPVKTNLNESSDISETLAFMNRNKR